MTPLATPDVPPADHCFLKVMLAMVLANVPEDPEAGSAEQQAVALTASQALGALQPRGAFQAMQAASVVSAWFGSMDLFRRAALPAVDDEQALKLRLGARELLRVKLECLAALERRQEQLRLRVAAQGEPSQAFGRRPTAARTRRRRGPALHPPPQDSIGEVEESRLLALMDQMHIATAELEAFMAVIDPTGPRLGTPA
jgi:hypothetical protein